MFLCLKELGCDEKITGLHMDSYHKIVVRKHVFLIFSHLETNNDCEYSIYESSYFSELTTIYYFNTLVGFGS